MEAISPEKNGSSDLFILELWLEIAEEFGS